jgi:hypothetical protein
MFWNFLGPTMYSSKNTKLQDVYKGTNCHARGRGAGGAVAGGIVDFICTRAAGGAIAGSTITHGGGASATAKQQHVNASLENPRKPENLKWPFAEIEVMPIEIPTPRMTQKESRAADALERMDRSSSRVRWPSKERQEMPEAIGTAGPGSDT